jgi:hypothetical protein
VLAADEFAVPGGDSGQPRTDGRDSHPYGAGAGPIDVPRPVLVVGLGGIVAAAALGLRRCLRRARPNQPG